MLESIIFPLGSPEFPRRSLVKTVNSRTDVLQSIDYSNELLKKLMHPGRPGGMGGGREGRSKLNGIIYIPIESDCNTQFKTLRVNPVVSPLEHWMGAADDGWGGRRVGVSFREALWYNQHFSPWASPSFRGTFCYKHSFYGRGEDLSAININRAENTHHFKGSESQSGRENTSPRGVRVAIGPKKHITTRGPGRSWN